MKDSTLLFLFICWGAVLSSQKYPYKTYTIYDGLTQMQTTCLFQDSRGYLWVGTKGGVSRFDGENFERFGMDQGLPGAYVSDVKEDTLGNIWIGFRKMGVVKYDGVSFTTFEIDGGTGDNKLEIDHQGRLWVFSSSGNTLMFNGKTLVLASTLIEAIENVEISRIGIFDRRAQQMVFYNDSLGLFSLSEGIVKQIKGLPGRFISFPRIRSKEGVVLVRSVLDNENVAISRVIRDTAFMVLELDQLRFSDDNYSVSDRMMIQHNNKRIIQVDLESGVEKELNDWDISWFRDILYDKAGDLWLATENGLTKFYGEGFEDFSAHLPEFIWSVVQDKEECIWFASYGFGLHKFDDQSFVEIKDYKPLLPKAEFYTGAIRNQQGNLLLPTSNGILQFDGSSFSWLDFSKAGNSPQHLYEDRECNLILSAVKGGIRVIKEKEPVAYYGLQEGIHSNDFIVCIGKDKDGMYWLGSDYGLSQFDLASKQFNNFTRAKGNLPSAGIFSVFRDFRNNMWFGSRDGLLRYDYDAKSIIRVAESEIISKVSFIIDINLDYLLIGTLDGLYLFNLRKYYEEDIVELKLYAQNNGFPGIQPIQNGAFRDASGFVWIPSRNSVVRMDPSKLNLNITPLRTIFTAVNRRPLAFSDDQPIIELAHNVDEATIYFQGVGLSRPPNTQYQYRFGGKDAKWSDWQTDNYVILTGLASGRKSLEVKSRAIATPAESILPAKLVLVIDLSFWKEPNFIYITTGGAILFIVAWIFALIRQWKWRRKAERNEQENRYLKIQTLQAQMNPHFVFNVLGTLQNLILKNNIKQANLHLVNLSKLIRNFLDVSTKANLPRGTDSENEISLEKEIELLRMYIDFERLQYQNRFDYLLQVDPNINPAIYAIPPLIIQPFVENAIKHGLLPFEGQGFLKINFRERGEDLVCLIEDNGIGRKRAREIRQRTLHLHESHGTDLVNNRVKILNEMGYHIAIITTDGPASGTVVRITISDSA